MGNHWTFVIAAYGVTALGTLAIVARSWLAMVQAENRVEKMTRQRNDPKE